jgi:hypothetical protein
MPEDAASNASPESRRRIVEEELEDLRQEIEHFRDEKERVRQMVGAVGGVPTFNTKIYNLIFIISLVACFAVSLMFFGNELVRLAMIELAIALVSLKLILLIASEAKVNHLQLWILSSLEWRLNEIMKQIKDRDTGT